MTTMTRTWPAALFLCALALGCYKGRPPLDRADTSVSADVEPSDDAVASEAGPGESEAGRPDVAIDAPVDAAFDLAPDPGTDAANDVPSVSTPKGPPGVSCQSDVDCAQGACLDGFCCDKPCSGACMSCAQIHTGKPDGTCAAVAAGKKDPRASCLDETGTNQCGNDGLCNGQGACSKVGSDHVCSIAFCNGALFTPTSTCDGKGACKPVGTINCGAVSCDAVDGCRTPCTVDKDCPSTSFCNLSTARCTALKIDGAACDKPNECSSGFCADGVCCNSACTDKCMACSASLTTQKSGLCAAVKVGTDPHESCAVDTTNECGTDGTCDGAGNCRMTGTDRECKPGTCSSGIFTHAASCDGKGACGPVTSETCATLACDAVTGCQKACTVDGECSTKSFCDLASKACTAKKDNGKACAAGTECTSGNCVDGMCCNSKCDTPCSSCKKAHTNDTDGLCASVVKGLDPYASCQDETATTPCGNTGSCNGAGSCQKADKGKQCHAPSCNGAIYTPADTCDGQGLCKAGSTTNCGDYQCLPATGCQTTCTKSSDCSSATYCDTSLAKPICVPKKKQGALCTNAGQCALGRCVDGVCCDSDCTNSCYACNVASHEGSCWPVSPGAKDPKTLCKVSGTTCGQDGTCNGSGQCAVAPVGKTGSDCSTSCLGSTLTINACDGKGSCAGASKLCDNSLICAGNACKTSCTDDLDCTGGKICATLGASRQCAVLCVFDDPTEASNFDEGCVFGP